MRKGKRGKESERGQGEQGEWEGGIVIEAERGEERRGPGKWRGTVIERRQG